MADPLPPDPYEALGVAKDATAAAIKAQYRKLALKFHPDKVREDAAKEEATDKFTKVQGAWEIIGDEARRARYDASVKLHELRKDVFNRHHGGDRRSGDADVRTASYKMPTESARGGDFFTRGPDRYGPKPSPQPQYEERRPSYASDEYEEPSRPTSRKYDEYEPRSSKRASPREDRDRARARDSRENERSSRKDKSRRTDRDVRRDRERKQADTYVEVQEEVDVSDEYERPQRTPPDDDHLQRARADFFAARGDAYAREASGNYDDRTRKTFQQFEEAKAHMERSRGANRGRGESGSRNPSPTDRRPSPVRMASSKDKVERAKRAEVKSSGGFLGVRHGSGERPKASRTKTEKEQKSSDEDRRSSRRKEETRDAKQPSLKQSKSNPPEVRPPYSRQRSHSMQDEQHADEQIPTFKRADTMPQSPTAAAPPRETRRRDNSRLHPDSASYPTPEPTPEAEPVKFRYGKEQVYADDGAFIPTPDGYVDAGAENYRTQEHVPLSRETGRQVRRESRDRAPRYTHSPEPMKDGERQSRRSSSARHTSQKPSMPPRTTSTQYIVEPEGNSYVRPAPVSRENSRREQMPTISRENSGREKMLFNEIRSSGVRSSSPRADYSYPPPQENVQYSRRYKDADVKVQSGYSRRQDDKPSYTRSGSALHRTATAVYA